VVEKPYAPRSWTFYRSNAKQGGKVWQLEKAEFNELIKKPCHYCGAAPQKREWIDYGKRCVSTDLTNGIDRVDTTRGYTLDNCVPCCRWCNQLKGSLPLDRFVAQVFSVFRNLWSNR
jgi:hypothetical protein